MENFHIITAKALQYNEKYGFRIKLRSERFKQTIFINWDNEDVNNTLRVVSAGILKAKGFEIIGAALASEDTDYIITKTFMPIR